MVDVTSPFVLPTAIMPHARAAMPITCNTCQHNDYQACQSPVMYRQYNDSLFIITNKHLSANNNDQATHAFSIGDVSSYSGRLESLSEWNLHF